MSKDYDLYLTGHVENVQKSWDWMLTNLLPLVDEWVAKNYEGDESIIDIYGIRYLVNKHDASKWSKEEYLAYDAYFYGPPATRKSAKVVDDFNRAFLFHIHKNPHHWQYWVLTHDDPATEPLDMPLNYIFEMICDWWSFSWKSGELTEIFDWYRDHEKHMILSKKTRKTVEYFLEQMKKVLEDQK